MFWKTMAILWTVLLLVLAGAAVQFVRTAQPGSSKVEVSLKEPAKGTQATAQPGASKVEVSPKGPAKGTQATAILTGVPPECPVIPSLLDLKGEQTAGQSRAAKLPKDLQDKSLEDLQRCLVVRRLTGNMVAIDVRGCKSDQQARELARAAADSYIQLIRKTKANTSGRTIKRFADERNYLQNKLRILRREIVSLCRRAPEAMVRGQKNVPLIRLENLSRKILEAEDTKKMNEHALIGYKGMLKDGSIANDPYVCLALETDSILQGLRFLLVEVKAGLQALPPNRDKKSAITVLEGEIKARRKKVLESQIEIIGLEYKTSCETATLRLADLKIRRTTAEAEARDLVRTLSTIDSLESEKKQLEDMLSKIEHRLLEVKMGLLEGMPELMVILP